MRTSTAFVALLAVQAVFGTVIFEERFDDASWKDRWVETTDKGKEYGPWKHTAGQWYGDEDANKGIQTGQDARFYAISSKFDQAFDNKGKTIVIQFSVKHEQKIDCGGGYVKVGASTMDLKKFNGDSEYNIMFGPDICGPGTRKVHVIFNYKGENKLIKREIPCETDQLDHLYTLVVKPDNTYEVFIDQESKQTGKLEDDWDFLEAKEIEDPAVSKPTDWVDEEMMDDPEASKPEGYDDIPEMITDPDAEKPEDWDDELDGEWEAPQIENPDYKGEWKAPRITNPDYKGEWVHPMIANPDYKPDDEIYHYEDFGSIGIDVWQVKAGSIFDNVFVTDDVDEAIAHGKKYFKDLKAGEKKMWDKAEEARQAKEAEEAKVREAEAKKREEEEKAKKSEEKDGEEDGEEWEEEISTKIDDLKKDEL